jgi:hypothetical protein
MGGGGLTGGGLGSGGTFTGSSGSSGTSGTFTGISGAQSIGVIGTNTRSATNSGSLWTPFAANPYAAGLTSGTTSRAAATFGQPLYNVTTTSVTTTGGTAALSRGSALGGYGGLGTGLGTSGTSNASVRRSPQYGATISFRYPRATNSRIQSEVANVLARSSALEASRGIQVEMRGNAIVLKGRAADAHDRKLAESLVRMTPGVHDVINEITLPAPVPAGAGIE